MASSITLLLLCTLALYVVAVPLHFEVTQWMGCPAGGPDTCPAATSSGLCFCKHDFDTLNGNWEHHYVFVESGSHVPEITAAGNSPAYYINAMNDYYQEGKTGAAAAALMHKDACDSFGGCSKVPKWWMLNEISFTTWGKGTPKYTKYVIDLAATLKKKYKLSLIVCAPFAAPKDPTHYGLWKQLSLHAYIGIENYVDGPKVKANKFSASWLKAQYQASIDAFAKMKISKSKLFLLESYDNGRAGKPWGRAGVSAADWIKIIKLRARVIPPLGFKGFIAYGFWGNQMKDTAAQRDKYYEAYLEGVKKLV